MEITVITQFKVPRRDAELTAVAIATLLANWSGDVKSIQTEMDGETVVEIVASLFMPLVD